MTLFKEGQSLRVPTLRVIVTLPDGDGPSVWAPLQLGSIVLGQSPACGLVVPDPKVSRKHCELRVTEQGVLLRDLGSKNGTFINDVRITEAFLTPGTSVRIGDSTFVLQESGGAAVLPLSAGHSFGSALGQSLAMRVLFARLERLAKIDVPILLLGEPGTGKEELARAIHQNSRRSEGPFVTVDCEAIPANHLEAKLFGLDDHVHKPLDGFFHAAHGGTIFFDEIGELPLDVQKTLLWVIEAKKVRRLNSTRAQDIDVRIIASTRRDLKAMVTERQFRPDLHFRLSVYEVVVPPLRERKDDIPLLVEQFLSRRHSTTKLSDLPPETLPMLMAYDWPGNVRELRDVVARLGREETSGERAAETAAQTPAVPRSEPIDILKTWVGAVLAAHRDGVSTRDGDAVEAWPKLLQRLEGSQLFARLCAGEPLRTRPCPVHRGRSGDHECPHHCDGTGWLREPSSPSVDGPTPFFVPFPAETSARRADVESVRKTLAKERIAVLRPRKSVEPNAIELRTRLAIEYAHRYRDKYPGGVFWVNAASDVRAAFAAHAETLALRLDEMPVGSLYAAKVLAFVDSLERRPRSLVVFDDVRDPDQLGATLRGLWGKAAPCRVLIVTSARIFDWPPSTENTPEWRQTHLQRTEEAAAILRARWDALDDAKARLVVVVASLLDKTVELQRERLAALTGLPLEDFGAYPGTRGPVLEALCLAGFVEEISPHLLRLPWGVQQHVRATLEEPRSLAFTCARRLHTTHLTPERVRERVFQNRIDDLLADLRAARYLYTIAEDTAFTAEIVAWLDSFTWNAVHLRWWDAAAEPSFFFQQSLLGGGNGLPGLAGESAPHLRERFDPSPDGPEHVLTLVGHTHAVTHVAVTPDGLRAISASKDYTLRVWDLRTGQLLRVLEGHEERIVGLAVLPDGKRARSLSTDGTIRLWDLDTGATLRVDGRSIRSRAAAMTPDGRVAVQACDRGCLDVYRAADGSARDTQQEIPIDTLVDRLWLSADGRFAATESRWGCEVVDLETGNLVGTSTPRRRRLVEPAPEITSHIVLAPSGGDASTSGSVTVWTPRRGFVKHVPRLFRVRACLQDRADPTRIGTTTDGSRIWGACRDQLEIYDAASFERLGQYDVPWEWVDGVVEASPGEFMAFTVRRSSGERASRAAVARLGSAEPPRILVGHRDGIQGMAFTKGGRLAVTASADATLKVWDLSCPRAEDVLIRHGAAVGALAARGTMAVSVGNGGPFRGFEAAGGLRVWDLERAKVIRTPWCRFEGIRAVALSAVPQRIVGVTGDELCVWGDKDLGPERTIDIRRPLTFHDGHQGKRDFPKGKVRAVAVTADGARAAVGVSRWVAMVDIDRERITATFEGHTDVVCAVAMTPRGERVVSASYDQTLKVWDGQGTLEHTLTGHTGPVLAVAVTSDGEWVASGSEDGTIRLWDLSRSDKPVTLEGHRAATRGISFTPSGRGVVSTSMDGTLVVWRIVDEPSIHGARRILRAHVVHRFAWREPLLGCAIASDGRTIVVGDAAGRVHLLDWVGVPADAMDTFLFGP